LDMEVIGFEPEHYYASKYGSSPTNRSPELLRWAWLRRRMTVKIEKKLQANRDCESMLQRCANSPRSRWCGRRRQWWSGMNAWSWIPTITGSR
jgi:hypothetical protein